MSILIVGAQGMLGSDLMEQLGNTYQVQGTDKEDFDITDRAETCRALAEIQPDWVINAAAYTQVDRCEDDAALAHAVNAEGPAHLAAACREVGARLLHVSTDYVFDGALQRPYREDDPVRPLSVYGQSKLQGELAVRSILEDAVIVRTAGLYGRRGVNFVNTIIRMSGERDELRVVNDQWVSPTYTVDLSRAIGTLMRFSPRGLFHVVNSGSCSWYQFARTIVDSIGAACSVIPIVGSELNRPAARPAFSVLSCSRYTGITGGTLRPWEDALTEYLSLR